MNNLNDNLTDITFGAGTGLAISVPFLEEEIMFKAARCKGDAFNNTEYNSNNCKMKRYALASILASSGAISGVVASRKLRKKIGSKNAALTSGLFLLGGSLLLNNYSYGKRSKRMSKKRSKRMSKKRSIILL